MVYKIFFLILKMKKCLKKINKTFLFSCCKLLYEKSRLFLISTKRKLSIGVCIIFLNLDSQCVKSR